MLLAFVVLDLVFLVLSQVAWKTYPKWPRPILRRVMGRNTLTESISALFSALVEYCQWEVFNASCPGPDQLILMETARYGRMRFGRCMREDHGSVGCSANVRTYLDWKCSGRRRCQLLIPDAVLHAAHPCPKELMPYLEASYSCITGSYNARSAGDSL